MGKSTYMMGCRSKSTCAHDGGAVVRFLPFGCVSTN